MADAHTIVVAKAFSETPFGRYAKDGPESGEIFRDKLLIPALEKWESVHVVLDGVDGLPSSFWEEVMGGLIRRGYNIDELRKQLTLEAIDAELKTYVRLGWRYAQEASELKH